MEHAGKVSTVSVQHINIMMHFMLSDELFANVPEKPEYHYWYSV